MMRDDARDVCASMTSRANASDETWTRMDDVDATRARGNAAFARGAHEDARALYDEALAMLDARASTREDADGTKDDGARAMVLCNRAACWARAGAHARCAEDCDRAIALDEGYVKAYYRRARAREAMDDLEGALEDFERARTLGEASAARECARLTPLVEARREEMKAEMLGKMKELGNSILGNFGLSLDNFKAEKDEKTGSYSIRFAQDDAKSKNSFDDDE